MVDWDDELKARRVVHSIEIISGNTDGWVSSRLLEEASGWDRKTAMAAVRIALGKTYMRVIQAGSSMNGTGGRFEVIESTVAQGNFPPSPQWLRLTRPDNDLWYHAELGNIGWWLALTLGDAEWRPDVPFIEETVGCSKATASRWRKRLLSRAWSGYDHRTNNYSFANLLGDSAYNRTTRANLLWERRRDEQVKYRAKRVAAGLAARPWDRDATAEDTAADVMQPTQGSGGPRSLRFQRHPGDGPENWTVARAADAVRKHAAKVAATTSQQQFPDLPWLPRWPGEDDDDYAEREIEALERRRYGPKALPPAWTEDWDLGAPSTGTGP